MSNRMKSCSTSTDSKEFCLCQNIGFNFVNTFGRFFFFSPSANRWGKNWRVEDLFVILLEYTNHMVHMNELGSRLKCLFQRSLRWGKYHWLEWYFLSQNIFANILGKFSKFTCWYTKKTPNSSIFDDKGNKRTKSFPTHRI